MTEDATLAPIHGDIPMVAIKRNRNIRDMLIHTKYIYNTPFLYLSVFLNLHMYDDAPIGVLGGL